MRHLLFRSAWIVPAILLVSCATQENGNGLGPLSSIPAGVAQEGTLANAKLVADASESMFEHLQIPVSERANTHFLKFVIQPPVGPAGRKAWREMWILMKDEKPGRRFILTFQEDGTGSADFRVEG